jgi:hypothetical protein
MQMAVIITKQLKHKKKKKKRKEKWGLSYHLGTTAPKIGEEGSSQSFNIISI